MKRFFALLVISFLVLNSVSVIASETTPESANEDDSVSGSSENYTEPVEEPSAPAPEPVIPDESGSDSDSFDILSVPVTNPPVDNADSNSIDLVPEDSDDDKPANLLGSEKKDSLESGLETDENLELLDDDELSDELEEDDKEEEQHEHKYDYISNNDGTHTVICTENILVNSEEGEESIPCDYEEIVPCTFEDGKCIYCGYEEVEENEFNPSIVFSTSHQTCKIGETNPLICLFISQEDYDIEYAQICFADYGQNSFINVGLAHGKYYDFIKDEFVYTSDNGWYASPNITADYPEGIYSVRSVFVRSTTGETVHYSLESDTLPKAFEETVIELSETGESTYETIEASLNEKPWEKENAPDEEPVSETIEIDEPSLEELIGEPFEDELDAPEDHEHNYIYTSNNDGTHTITCSGTVISTLDDDTEIELDCDYEEIEECPLDEDGKCIYCGYSPDDETEFNPSISLSLSNQTCKIGADNPLICLHISQDNYDIAYAQICFANYGHNKFINLGLARGKYFDYSTNEFVYTSDDGWYASPNITEDYTDGIYSVRSIYIRSTTGETVHYTLESDSLPDNYQNSSICLTLSDSISYESLKEMLPEKPWEENNSSTEESEDSSKNDEEPVSEAIENNEPSLDELIGEPVENELDELDTQEETEHEHVFVYTSNNDGTHTITCSGTVISTLDDDTEIELDCDYEEIEECILDEDGKCIYCGYSPDDETEFNPSISLSLSNQTCKIGEDNPLICLHISQDNYDIAYAQICFANYGHNKFINLGLARGKYFDYSTNEFVYTSDDGWYASPNITEDFADGIYSVRSIYIRSTTGETVHYTLESDSLPDNYQNSSICLTLSDSISYESLKEMLPEKPWEENNSSTEESEDSSKNDEEPVSEAIENNEPSLDELIGEPLETELVELDTQEETEHEHVFVYTSNNDGTHTITCSGTVISTLDDDTEIELDCDYEEIEECILDEDGKCIYCGYSPDDETEFNPSISLSLSNQTCKIGEDNPLICLHISQDNYDIAYAQICFANYGHNKFINLGLARGKYFDYSTNEFVYTSDDGWYASPNITEDFADGIYSVRSIYIRSTTGESIHYSLETDSLDDSYTDNSITLQKPSAETSAPDTSENNSYYQLIERLKKLFGFG